MSIDHAADCGGKNEVWMGGVGGGGSPEGGGCVKEKDKSLFVGVGENNNLSLSDFAYTQVTAKRGLNIKSSLG